MPLTALPLRQPRLPAQCSSWSAEETNRWFFSFLNVGCRTCWGESRSEPASGTCISSPGRSPDEVRRIPRWTQCVAWRLLTLPWGPVSVRQTSPVTRRPLQTPG